MNYRVLRVLAVELVKPVVVGRGAVCRGID